MIVTISSIITIVFSNFGTVIFMTLSRFRLGHCLLKRQLNCQVIDEEIDYLKNTYSAASQKQTQQSTEIRCYIQQVQILCKVTNS